MNGIVTITKVTNSLSVANNNEYNQVLQPEAEDFHYFLIYREFRVE